MACNPIEAFTNEACKYVRNGVKSIYVVSHASLVPVTGSTEVYSTSVSGIVNQIGIGADNFVKIDYTKKTPAVKETGTIEDNGSFTLTHEITFSINSFSANNKEFTESLLGNPVVVLAQLKSGKWAGIGLDGTVELKSFELTVDDSNNVRSLTFSGDGLSLIPEVDATIIAYLTT